MYFEGKGVTPSLRRARELYERSIELGNPMAVENMQVLTKTIANVTSRGKPPHHATPTLSASYAHVHTFHSVSQVAPLMDKRVEIHGTSRADMNGKCGVATDFHYYDYREDRSKSRYTVQLDSGEAFKVKPASVRAERKKGKGKKGRGARS